MTTGRIYAGSFPLANLPRLTSLLAGGEGEVRYELKFGRNVIGQRMVEMHVETGFPLICQVSLDVFVLPVEFDTRLGFVKDENDDAGLPEGFEPFETDVRVHSSKLRAPVQQTFAWKVAGQPVAAL